MVGRTRKNKIRRKRSTGARPRRLTVPCERNQNSVGNAYENVFIFLNLTTRKTPGLTKKKGGEHWVFVGLFQLQNKRKNMEFSKKKSILICRGKREWFTRCGVKLAIFVHFLDKNRTIMALNLDPDWNETYKKYRAAKKRTRQLIRSSIKRAVVRPSVANGRYTVYGEKEKENMATNKTFGRLEKQTRSLDTDTRRKRVE